MHGPINVKSPNNISKWQMGFNSAFKGLIQPFEAWLCHQKTSRISTFCPHIEFVCFVLDLRTNSDYFFAQHSLIVLITETFHHNGNVITEQGTGEQNPLFQLAIDTILTSATTRKQKQINTPPATHSNQFQLFHDSSRQQYGTYIIHYSMELIAFSAQYIVFNYCNFNLVYRYTLSVKFNSIYYVVTVTRCCSYSCLVLLMMVDSDA
jgi:hypothetical protein